MKKRPGGRPSPELRRMSLLDVGRSAFSAFEFVLPNFYFPLLTFEDPRPPRHRRILQPQIGCLWRTAISPLPGMFRYRSSSSSSSKSLLENRLATVSEMIQSCSAPTIARCFLSDRNRARAGARVVERFTERGTKDNRRGYHDCAISLASRYAARG